MTTERWYERFAWVVFTIIGLMGVVIALPVLVDPAAGAGVFERLDGVSLPAAIDADPAALAYVEFVYRFAFSALFGVDLMTVLIAIFAFRRGARWAWVAFWYWPALYLFNAVTYEAAARPVQLAMFAITTAALAASFRKAWRDGTPRSEAPGRAAPQPQR